MEGVWKIRACDNITFYLGKVTCGHSYNGRRIGTRMRSMDWCYFQWPQWPLTQILRSRYYLTWKWYRFKIELHLQWQTNSRIRSIDQRQFQWHWTTPCHQYSDQKSSSHFWWRQDPACDRRCLLACERAMCIQTTAAVGRHKQRRRRQSGRRDW